MHACSTLYYPPCPCPSMSCCGLYHVCLWSGQEFVNSERGPCNLQSLERPCARGSTRPRRPTRGTTEPSHNEPSGRYRHRETPSPSRIRTVQLYGHARHHDPYQPTARPSPRGSDPAQMTLRHPRSSSASAAAAAGSPVRARLALRRACSPPCSSRAAASAPAPPSASRSHRTSINWPRPKSLRSWPHTGDLTL